MTVVVEKVNILRECESLEKVQWIKHKQNAVEGTLMSRKGLKDQTEVVLSRVQL